jgi:hypothetical protein
MIPHLAWQPDRRVDAMVESAKGKFYMTTPLDPSLYPASYRTSVWRGGLKILGIMTLVLVTILARTQIIDRGVAPSTLVFIILMLLFFLLTLVNGIFAQVTLYPDRIERVTWFGRKSMPRADVAKLERRGLFRIPILVSKKGLFEGIQLPSGIEADAAWEAWMTIAQDGDAVQARDALNAGQRS